MKIFRQFQLKTFDNRGLKLTPVELKDVVPFEVKRVYYFGPASSEVVSGQHCHKIEEEIFVMMRGSCTAVIDRGQGLEEIMMNGPNDAIYVPNFDWHGFKNFSSDALVLALSSTNYSADRSDYVEDYEEFKRLRK
ncbi:MAG: fdtA [Candidatus Magasanikbacteria bacterium]|nr:fdtA [Candidatus Magasanikbacteria bacterium]